MTNSFKFFGILAVSESFPDLVLHLQYSKDALLVNSLYVFKLLLN